MILPYFFVTLVLNYSILLKCIPFQALNPPVGQAGKKISLFVFNEIYNSLKILLNGSYIARLVSKEYLKNRDDSLIMKTQLLFVIKPEPCLAPRAKKSAARPKDNRPRTDVKRIRALGSRARRVADNSRTVRRRGVSHFLTANTRRRENNKCTRILVLALVRAVTILIICPE